MDPLCDKVELFVDGELSSDEAEAFRLHLPDCAKCQREMDELMQLKLLGQRYAQHHPAGPVPDEAPWRLAGVPWRVPAFVAAAALAVALVVVVLVRKPATPALQSDVWLARSPGRLLEARISHPGADNYRPPAPKMMGGGAALALPLGDLALLEQSDPHGLAAAFLVRDDKGLADQALQRLEALGRSPDVDSDRAVALLLKGKREEALRLLEAVLAEHPRHPQALWNQGLVLRELGLPLRAAWAFSQVAALKEPGWAEEATQKAQALQRTTSERRERWQAGSRVGESLLGTAPAALPGDFSQLPSARRYFYEAVRGATSREQVLALLPLAQQLDKKSGGQVLEAYVRRISEADFTRRAPLSEAYRALTRDSLPAKEQERVLAQLLASKEDDLLLGAIVWADAFARHQQLFEQKAAESGDPWFQLLAAQLRAKADGDWRRAASTLLEATRGCKAGGLEYRCLFLQRELSTLYIKHHELELARRHTEEGWNQARALGEWQLESGMLWNLAEIARLSGDMALARAYLAEFLERDQGQPELARRAHQELAVIAMQQLRVDEARREIDAALATGLPLKLPGAFALADISRLKSAPGDEGHLNRALEASLPELSPGERAITTHVLGRFHLERDVERGRALLWRAIEEAEALAPEQDTGARRARAYSFTSLLLERGKRGDFQEALKLLVRERGLELPRQCLLVATADSERLLLMALGADGALTGHYDEARRQPLSQRLDGVVPEVLLAALRPCEAVQVLARPPLHGRVGLLPPELAWSYLTRTTAPLAPRLGPAVHLVVMDVEQPAGGELKRLNAWTPSFGPEERRELLSGAEATPSRVLAAMKEASEIDLVAHGILNDSSDASYLLLAPGPDGSQLGAQEVRKAALQATPFVVLAACHAAHATYSVDHPLSLPAAFIDAGARGVLAATVEIPDLEAQAFFNAVRERMRSGMAPSLALREERMRWRDEGRGAQWLDSVLLFE